MKILRIGFICLFLMFVFFVSSCAKEEVVMDQLQCELPEVLAEPTSAAVMIMP